MLPPQLSKEAATSIKAYFQATYPFRSKATATAFHDFIAQQQGGMFKGPYVSVKLPFRKAESESESPLGVKLGFSPYDHQLRAFRRLTTREDHQPQPTIMTTGTGSGKTEAFLFPLLDYALQNKDRPGIKAIILYPMNALATDQATRFADTIYKRSALKGAKLSVGLLIGQGMNDKQRPTAMGRDHVIEDRDTILNSPPDILLTNFKMLDYVLMRAKYQRLWNLNLTDPGLLKYLVLDELHTYDGAQGSDVANLIRRLKLKFGMERGELCPVGTSATVGEEKQGVDLLCQYAGKIFGESFSPQAIIGETRLSVEDFFTGQPHAVLPDDFRPETLQFQKDETFVGYLGRQRKIWGIDQRDSPSEVGDWLKGSPLFKTLIASCVRAPISIAELLKKLGYAFEAFGALTPALQRDLIYSLLSLADLATDAGDRPLFAIQVQLWLRELSGIVREMATEPGFRWRLPGRTKETNDIAALPVWNCRDCGENGWLSAKPESHDRFITDTTAIFDKYFGFDNTVWFLTDHAIEKEEREYEPTEEMTVYADPETLFYFGAEREGLVRVHACRKYDEHKSSHRCPRCNSGNGVTIVGGRTATLASIITGQVLATELDETKERDRKVLAFTNSVQDAAHQAGFIQSRNYNFSFRTALQTAVKNNQRNPSLASLQQTFSSTWRGILDQEYPGEGTEAYVNQFFPARLHGKEQPRDYVGEGGGYQRRFLEEFDLAIDWQIASEFGYNATVGRTLEKTGTCAVKIDPDRLNQVYPLVREWLASNAIVGVDDKNFLHFLTGLLLRMRQRGAVSHPFLEKYRTEGATQWNLNYTRDRRHFLNQTFGSRSRFPRPVVTGPLRGDLPLDGTYTNQRNWFHAWFRRCFPLAADTTTVINEWYQELFPQLEITGIVDAVAGKEGTNYCLNPTAVLVGADAGAVECLKCNDRQTVFVDDESMVGMPCISYGCTGVYATDEASTPNYYRAVYNRRRAPRIYATDHTGLLDRADREGKEYDFKNRPNTDSLNTLVATSTLEMGIDIGDLNVAMLSGVPPLPSNFLQRVGRAGRKSGSALVLNIAAANSHDLFYFEEPGEMMAGKVHTPGCFLSAKEIIKRHFLAYLIDSWSALDPGRNGIPARLKDVRLYPDRLNDPEWFPNRLQAFIGAEGAALLVRFRSGYTDDEIEQTTFTELEGYLLKGYLAQRVVRCFRQLVDDLQALTRSGASAQKEIDSGKYGKEDEAFKELNRQIKSLRAARRKVEDRQTLEQLTNYGLLPNYAFPETGVTMTGEVMTMLRREDGPPEFVPVIIETVRSAKSALREMAPGSQFYTQGWRLPVTGINTTDWEEVYEEYRFCGKCDNLQPAAEVGAQLCPVCSDASFGTLDNLHGFYRLREVKATAKRDKATIKDEREERERGGHLISRHFDFRTSENRGAFALRDIPFGVEYRTQVLMREVNAGHRNHQQKGRSLEIAGKRVNGAGYITCRQCGKSTLHQRKEEDARETKKAEDYHYPYCRHREHAYTGEQDEVMKELFLLRELRSEVLKLLLPIQEFETEEHIGMFMAGIYLGLRHYYGGNPQHIDLYEHWEFNPETNRFDVYLIMLDNIPGGTGYLSKLFTPEIITEVLKLAYRQIKGCSCQDRGLDGCYHCIFSYATQHFSHKLSRAETERLFGRILESCNDWETMGSLKAIGNNSQIEESELERRFIRLFRTLARQEDSGWKYKEVNIDGVLNYELTFEAEDRKYVYDVVPQFSLGQAQGVGLHTDADHLIRLKAAREEGEDLGYNEIAARTQVPCFLDGWAYHASQTNARFPGDVARRHAVAKSGRYLSWTLSFPDVSEAEQALGMEDKNQKNKNADELARAFTSGEGKGRGILLGLPGKQGLGTFGKEETNFGRLRWWLERGLKPETLQLAAIAYLTCLQHDASAKNFTPRDAALMVTGKALIDVFSPVTKPTPETVAYLDNLPPMNSGRFKALAFSRLVNNGMYYRLTAEAEDDPALGFDKDSWYLFWRIFNLLQTVSDEPPQLKIIGSGLGAALSLEYAAPNSVVSTPASESVLPEIKKILTYYDPPYHDLVTSIHKAGKLSRRDLEGEFNLLNERGEVMAAAIIGSVSSKIVVGPFSETDAACFLEQGYSIRTPDSLNPDEL
jgi:DEAD/DEAH box helicase domain-containing protein